MLWLFELFPRTSRMCVARASHRYLPASCVHSGKSPTFSFPPRVSWRRSWRRGKGGAAAPHLLKPESRSVCQPSLECHRNTLHHTSDSRSGGLTNLLFRCSVEGAGTEDIVPQSVLLRIYGSV